MKTVRLLCLVICGLLMPSAIVSAQSANSAASAGSANGGGRGAAQVDWDDLQTRRADVAKPLPAAANAAAADKARGQHVADLLDLADKFKAYYGKYPSDGNAPEAKRQEAMALIGAWALGDTSQDGRRQQLVAEVRKIPTIAARDRLEVAGTADNIGVDRPRALGRDARLKEYEKVARALVTEFPDVADSYEGLARVAQYSPDADALTIAHDLLGMAGASEEVKAQANIIIARRALVGTALGPIATDTLGANNIVDQSLGHPVVLYAWATWAPGSVAQAKAIAAQAPSGAVFIGVCLDGPDLSAAKTAAQSMPGTQVYDPMGVRGKFSGRLWMLDPGLIYLADSKGVIRSVSAQRDFAATVAALPNL